jgi:hypothetical protein
MRMQYLLLLSLHPVSFRGKERPPSCPTISYIYLRGSETSFPVSRIPLHMYALVAASFSFFSVI